MSTKSSRRELESAIRQLYFDNTTYAPTIVKNTQKLISKDSESNTLPRIHIVVTDNPTTEGFESTDRRERTAQLSVVVATSADDESASTQDDLVEAVEEMLEDRQSLLTALNTSDLLYVYTARITGLAEEVNERTRLSVFTLSIPYIYLSKPEPEPEEPEEE